MPCSSQAFFSAAVVQMAFASTKSSSTTFLTSGLRIFSGFSRTDGTSLPLSESAVVPLASGKVIPPSYTAVSDYYYNLSVEDGQVRVFTTNHSAAVLGQPVKVLLTYQPTPAGSGTPK